MIKTIFNALVLTILSSGNLIAQALDIYINAALKNSPLLFENNNQQLAGRLDSLLLLATFKPQVNQISQAMYAPTGSDWGYDDAITNGGNVVPL